MRHGAWLWAVAAGFLAAGTVRAGGGEHPAPKLPAEFERLKSLAGRWEGVTEMEGKKEKATVVYEVTAGGTAVLERLFPGTPHEMVSVYHVSGGKVRMTHYCMLGNSPRMTLKSATADTLAFELKGSDGLSSAKEPHMHGLTMTWKGPDRVTAEWVSFEKGKKAQCSVFEYTRKGKK
jgi:hypothetical protein